MNRSSFFVIRNTDRRGSHTPLTKAFGKAGSPSFAIAGFECFVFANCCAGFHFGAIRRARSASSFACLESPAACAISASNRNPSGW